MSNALKALMGAGASKPKLSLVAETHINAQNITIPTSINGGDLAILAQYAGFGPAPAPVTPAGFTNITSEYARQSTINHRMMFDYKVLTTADRGASITGMVGTPRTGITPSQPKSLFVFRLDKGPITSVTVNDVYSVKSPDGTGYGGDPPPAPLNASNAVGASLIFAQHGSRTGSGTGTQWVYYLQSVAAEPDFQVVGGQGVTPPADWGGVFEYAYSISDEDHVLDFPAPVYSNDRFTIQAFWMDIS